MAILKDIHPQLIISMLSTKWFNENRGFMLYKQTSNYSRDYDLDKNYLSFSSLSALQYILNGCDNLNIDNYGIMLKDAKND